MPTFWMFWKRPPAERSGKLIPFHDLLHRECGGDVERHPGVMSLAVAGRTRDQRIVVGDAGFLRGLGNAVDVGPERDHRLSRPPARDERGRNARVAFLHREAVLLEDADDVPVRFEFLEAELPEAEDGIH